MLRENVLSADNQQGRSSRSLTSGYVCGFVDGEGSFHIAIYQDERMKTGIKVIPEFHVSQRVTSRAVLDRLVDFFNCGYVKANHPTNPNDQTYVFCVRDRQDLLKRIIPFFRKEHLQTEKANDFALFARVVEAMADGQHRTDAGVRKVLTWAYQMNGGGRYRRQDLQKTLK